MNKIKKIMILLLAVVMSLSFSACNADENSETDGSNESTAKPLQQGVTLKFTLPGDVSTSAETQVFQAVMEKLKADGLDFKLETTYIPWGEYWNRVSMIAASQEDQDILWTHSSTIGGMIGSFALAPLNSAIETYGKSLKNNIPDYYWSGVTVNNRIYGIPRTAPVAGGQQMMYVRYDLLEKYNQSIPKTYEDVMQYFENVKTQEDGMIPTDITHSEWMLREFGHIYFPMGGFSRWPVYVDVSKDVMKVEIWYESEIFKIVSERNSEIYNKGYRHTERGTVTDAEGWFANGALGSMWSSMLKPTERVESLHRTNPSIKGGNIIINPNDDYYIYSAVDNIISVYAGSKKVNEAVAFMNWVREKQENFDLFSYGVEGVNYNKSGIQINYEGISQNNFYQPPAFAWSDVRFERYSDKLDESYVEDLRTWDANAKISPLNGFIVDTSEIQTELAQIQAVEGEYVDDLAYGIVEYSQVYDDFIKKLKDAGIEKVRDEIQKQADEFIASK